MKIEEIPSPGLAKDVDEPEDLADAAALLNPADQRTQIEQGSGKWTPAR